MLGSSPAQLYHMHTIIMRIIIKLLNQIKPNVSTKNYLNLSLSLWLLFTSFIFIGYASGFILLTLCISNTRISPRSQKGSMRSIKGLISL